jgi:hypothetical protein
MKTLEEFVEAHLGSKVDFDGQYGAQCVDLARQYWEEVWDVPQPPGVIGATDFFIRHEERPRQMQHMDRHNYIAGSVPPKGAVVVFGPTATNQYGHIGICIDATQDSIQLFEQNGFKQDGAKISVWKYDCVLGWLTRRGLRCA